jgi:hypothetical protein
MMIDAEEVTDEDAIDVCRALTTASAVRTYSARPPERPPGPRRGHDQRPDRGSLTPSFVYWRHHHPHAHAPHDAALDHYG